MIEEWRSLICFSRSSSSAFLFSLPFRRFHFVCDSTATTLHSGFGLRIWCLWEAFGFFGLIFYFEFSVANVALLALALHSLRFVFRLIPFISGLCYIVIY